MIPIGRTLKGFHNMKAGNSRSIQDGTTRSGLKFVSAVNPGVPNRIRHSSVLRKLSPENIYVAINPSDAGNLGIQPNELVFVESQRGRVRAK
ncbi:MAG: hypothetical protein IID46_07340, partial [Planctomycetes bacterium]|nr:hypothetical protein [Planctomycetota bacterium]